MNEGEKEEEEERGGKENALHKRERLANSERSNANGKKGKRGENRVRNIVEKYSREA